MTELLQTQADIFAAIARRCRTAITMVGCTFAETGSATIRKGTNDVSDYRPKVLVDFDGVWTTVDGQAAAVDAARGQGLAAASGLPLDVVLRCCEAVSEAINAEPLQHGWRLDGRITAYADEDPFLRHNATSSGIGILAERGHAGCRELQQALAAHGHADLSALGSTIFMDASHAYLADHGHDLLPSAPAVLRALLEIADVVFCTNFTPDAVARSWVPRGFTFAGPDATPGLTLRGEARKQVLTNDPARLLPFGERPVSVDRSFYRAALEAEAPDVVVGDVFSLDLALPLTMRADDHPTCRPLCLLARTRFTPTWSLGMAGGGDVPGLQLLSSLDELVPLVAALARAPRRKG
jgi:hypothetical protein